MRALFRKLRDSRFRYNPLVEIRVYREHLLHNLGVFADFVPDGQVAPVLKSNAYGHGLIHVARVFDQQESIPFLMVDSYYEALVLRNEHIAKPVLVLGYTRPETIAESRLKNVSFGILTLEQLKVVAKVLKGPQAFHVMMDTGMHREGLLLKELDEAIEIIKENKNMVIEGLCSHFADADGEIEEFTGDVERENSKNEDFAVPSRGVSKGQTPFTKSQGRRWDEIKTAWQRAFPETKYYHLANTAGTRLLKGLGTNVSRVGLGLYGMDDYPSSNLNLKPALEMKTILTGVKKLKKGEKVGYGATFTAPKDMLIGNVPVGYFEGVPRYLSNKGRLQVKGVMCPIVGRVSMNITTVDVSEVSEVSVGDEVVVISTTVSAENSAENIAHLADTIQRDVLVKIPSMLRRVVV